MLDPAIQIFLAERKVGWLKDKLKSCKNESEQSEVENKANEKFSLDNWLPDAAKRAGWLSMVSHTGKFTHPSAKISSVIAQSPRHPDGFLKTGNAQVELDVFGNAAALDVYKFLTLILNDGQTVLSHLEQDSDTIKAQFTPLSVPISEAQHDLFNTPSVDIFTELQEGLLAIKQNFISVKTSEKIKQVYFPVNDDYHLLSILTPSGLMFNLKQRINNHRFSDAAKQAHEDRRKQQHNEQGFNDIYNLTVIGFGGTKPQNISVLNSQNGGTAYLLSSMPPPLEKYRIPKPNKNFFTDILWIKAYRHDFWQLQKLYKSYKNTKDIKIAIENVIISVFQQVIEKVWQTRQLEAGWSEDTSLNSHQKIWLDNAHTEQRETEDDWLNKVITDFSIWFISAYTKTVGEEAIPLGDVELAHIKKIISDYQEDLR